MKWVWLAAIFAVASGLLASPSAKAASPSFDCAKGASAVEKVICADTTLSERDQTMVRFYARAIAAPADPGLSPVARDQRQWLKSRDICPKFDSPAACLLRQYDQRIRTLAIATLFEAPDEAFSELKRQDLNDGRLIEAVSRYATIDDLKTRKRVVAPLIAPTLASIKARGVVGDGDMASEIEQMSPTSAAASDRSFGLLLNAAAVFLYLDAPTDRRGLSLPCRTLALRPGLLPALGARYWSTMDNYLIADDCPMTAARIPALKRIMDAAMQPDEVCQGTDRYGGYRELHKTIQAILLKRPEIWEARLKDTLDEDETKFRAKHPALINQAQEAVSKYYQTSFSLLARESGRLGQEATWIAIHQAQTRCP